MISIDFSYAVAIYLVLALTLILMVWLCVSKEKDKDLTLDPKFIWFCSVCTYAYVNTKEEAISTCPRCGSYNKRA
jgi:predicted Zn-ribbon and HTH transcriptional regulator